ncbi:hypothetical protein ACFL59_11790 [Planctomycetota bacterium]
MDRATRPALTAITGCILLLLASIMALPQTFAEEPASFPPVAKSLGKTAQVNLELPHDALSAELTSATEWAPILKYLHKKGLLALIDQGTREVAAGKKFGEPKCFCDCPLTITFLGKDSQTILFVALHSLKDKPSCASASFAYVGSGVKKCSFNLRSKRSSRKSLEKIVRKAIAKAKE